jgi:uncharacterized protein YllA (UPF0747 family)
MNQVKKQNRIILCAKDIKIITGKSDRTVQRIMADIKSKNNISRSDYITIEDICTHLRLTKETVEAFLE